ncbi:hypothetical protein LJB88_04385 [Erysipelotrichaceae bacterium OttesenSCG-928-M19]|nr:hypothetical protein [Erysipelotrichaceae bacterium OttesenSCG-928-M19]
MFNRTLIIVSVSLTVIVLGFSLLTLYLAFSQGAFTNPQTNESMFSITPAFKMFIAFFVLALIGAICTGVSYKMNSMLILLVGTFFLFIASIPNVMYVLTNNSSADPYLLTKLIAPSFILNALQIFLINRGVTIYKSGLSNIKDKLNKK